MQQRVLLAGATLPPQTRGEVLSQEARRLLSQLAAGLGLDCPPSLWSPRGTGPPTHPALPANCFAGITHKRGQVIVGLSEWPFGIDLEYANPRHARRLQGLIELLPEYPVRQAILQAECPQQAFYQAWTLHEALFKLASQTDHPASSVLDTRLHSILTEEGHTGVWQSRQWTFTITGCAPLLLPIDPGSMLTGAQPVKLLLTPTPSKATQTP